MSLSTRTEMVLNVALVTLTLCALFVTGLVAKNVLAPTRLRAPASIAQVEEWRNYSRAGQRVGSPQASVVIVEFSDFQCPFCKTLARTMDRLRAKYPTDIQTVFRHYPLTSIHPQAFKAAIAAECAALQGRFVEFHDVVFADSDSIQALGWMVLGKRAGLSDMTAYGKCVSNESTSARVREDIAAGEALRVSGTPTVLVNDKRIRVAPTFELLDSLVAVSLRDRK